MSALTTLIAAATPTPVPTLPAVTINENLVTPGWEGFTAIFVVAAVVILLAVDLIRRLRKLNYRTEIRERLEAEADAQDAQDAQDQQALPPAK